MGSERRREEGRGRRDGMEEVGGVRRQEKGKRREERG
jgi:hypothetical protein